MRKLILIVTVVLSCSFSAPAQNNRADSAETGRIPDKVFTTVDKMPEYPGGIPALINYLSANIRYPELARKNNVQGRVIVQFVVGKTGKVTLAVVKRDIGDGCGNEALRIVRNMPDWKPGMQNGVPVNVYFTLPISFKLSDPEPVMPEQARFR